MRTAMHGPAPYLRHGGFEVARRLAVDECRDLSLFGLPMTGRFHSVDIAAWARRTHNNARADASGCRCREPALSMTRGGIYAQRRMDPTPGRQQGV